MTTIRSRSNHCAASLPYLDAGRRTCSLSFIFSTPTPMSSTVTTGRPVGEREENLLIEKLFIFSSITPHYAIHKTALLLASEVILNWLKLETPQGILQPSPLMQNHHPTAAYVLYRAASWTMEKLIILRGTINTYRDGSCYHCIDPHSIVVILRRESFLFNFFSAFLMALKYIMIQDLHRVAAMTNFQVYGNLTDSAITWFSSRFHG